MIVHIIAVSPRNFADPSKIRWTGRIGSSSSISNFRQADNIKLQSKFTKLVGPCTNATATCCNEHKSSNKPARSTPFAINNDCCNQIQEKSRRVGLKPGPSTAKSRALTIASFRLLRQSEQFKKALFHVFIITPILWTLKLNRDSSHKF